MPAPSLLIAAALPGAWIIAVAALAWTYRRVLARLWREPAFRVPVLIVESDDWGAGPLAQAEALQRIGDVLQGHRDAAGRTPVMSLALVLAVPDGPAIARTGQYRAVELDAPCFAPIRQALQEGAARGVFALQLHGMEHYWPPTLMASADPAVQAWLRQPVPATTEDLPSPLQSRWVDAGTLPSRPLGAVEIAAAVAAEVRAYARIVGEPPRVVVPPTFVWTREVEQAWVAAGLRCVVTPGWRYPARGADGLPCGDEGPIINGDRSGEIGCLVRTDYFEPRRGRGAAHALGVFERTVAEGRPCLLENHRDNFIVDAATREHALAELDALLAGVRRRQPDLRFMSTWELHAIVQRQDPEWLVAGSRERIACVWERLRGQGRLWKLLRLLGVAALGNAAIRLAARRPGGR